MFYIILLIPIVLSLDPKILYSCDFEQPIENCFQGKTIDDPHNCLIVPCTNLEQKSHCMVITQNSHGGDCFTQYINHEVDPSDPDDFIAIVFDYMMVRHPQLLDYPDNSGIYVGYEEQQTSSFYWIATHDPSYLTFKETTENSVTLIALHNIWTKVSVLIKPDSNKPIRFTFQDWDGLPHNIAGDFLVDNITIVHRGVCPINCATCDSFQSCTVCSHGYILHKGSCIQQQCLLDKQFPIESVKLGWKNKEEQVYQLLIENIQFDFDDCFLQQLFIKNELVKQEDYDLTQNSDGMSLSFQITTQLLNQYGCIFEIQNQESASYTCAFAFQILFQETSVISQQITWKQEFLVNLQDLTFEAGSDSQYYYDQLEDPDIIQITIESELNLCENRECKNYITKDKTIQRGTPFYVSQKVTNNSISEVKFEHKESYLMGNGTMLTLTPQEEIIKEGETIYKFVVELVVTNGYIQVSSQLKLEDESKRVLQKQAQYVMGGNIFIASILSPSEESQNSYEMIILYVFLAVVGFGLIVLIVSCIYKCKYKKGQNQYTVRQHYLLINQFQIRQPDQQNQQQQANQQNQLQQQGQNDANQ